MRTETAAEPANIPKTDGALYDLLQELFGIGEYDEVTSEEPFWKFRRREVAKVVATRKKWDTAIADLYVAALYCKAHGHPVRAASWLNRHIKPAWDWWKYDARHGAVDFDDLYAKAIHAEANKPESTWLSRLLRTAPGFREEVYKQWVQAHHPPA